MKGAQNRPDAVLLVDIGGGNGHDIAAFHVAYPYAPGKLVLQDLQPVLSNIQSLDKNIICQPHDFFQPQPIKCARAYYFRYILHDWPEEYYIRILRQTANSMKHGYSKVLIFEWILPIQNVPLQAALLDINSMALTMGWRGRRNSGRRCLQERN
ncbi:S-adenosyl-L-methionine-dependent methyltransferase [Lojkania enalia]|uniref:S-adenosyl-L-methionine-dependent methyltransferase n=1 Tax=Lojkania enalia TaxID=147567 RepID=A0A9P4KBU5_9PLEO|nr:S-adenosyl-L-methionine-dependent methyltransferase [Didymosphaeria enalia]